VVQVIAYQASVRPRVQITVPPRRRRRGFLKNYFMQKLKDLSFVGKDSTT
jgi:hypothetical protein